MKILFVTSELHPFAKSGGLADATASLADALAAEGHTVKAVIPRYSSIDRESLRKHDSPLGVPMAHGEEWAAVYETETFKRPDSTVTVYFIDHEGYFGREGIYGSEPALAFDDNLLRYTFLTRASLQLCRLIDYTPDIIHVHDWPTSMMAAIKEVDFSEDFGSIPVILSIHNIGYQGTFPLEDLPSTGLTPAQARKHGLIRKNEINMLNSGSHSSDRVTTVSPTYAHEILEPRFSFGLDGTLRNRMNPITGILNGIDIEEWNPETDPNISANFSVSRLANKKKCKEELQREMGLPVDPETAVIGIVTRLVDQKGIGDLFGPTWGSAYSICSSLPVQMAILGSGAYWCEEEIRTLSRSLPNLKALIGYDNGLAHRIEAGADFFLMPSVYEPCGLNQMYSMRYGTVPIVTRTGGLADSVDEETGFFVEPLSPDGIFNAVKAAVSLFTDDKAGYLAMQRRGMKRDFSWKRSARGYIEIYNKALSDRKR